MRRLIKIWILILTALTLFGTATAEDTLILSAERLTVGETLNIKVNDGAARRTFELIRDGERVNTGAVTEACNAALYAQTPGDYVLNVIPEGGKILTARFSIYDRPQVTLSVNRERLHTGEVLTATAQASGGMPELSYEFSVWRGTERICAETTREAVFDYTPFTEGNLTLSVAVTDALGNTAAAAAPPVTVSGSGGITVKGDLSPILAQGAIRVLTLDTPGPWSARSDHDALTLLNTCGDSGDQLVFAMGGSDSGTRTAVITVSSLGLSKRITVVQTDDTEAEEEVRLFTELTDRVTIDGRTAIFWLCPADGTVQSAAISASGDWSVAADADWLRFQRDGDRLKVWIDRNAAALPRSTDVTVRCGEASAVIRAAQPGIAAGANVQEVVLDRDRGEAYSDSVDVRVFTDADAQTVALTIDRQAPILFGRETATAADGGLRWRFQVPLSGAGAQSWLISALNEAGSGAKALVTMNVGMEAVGFTGPAVLSADRDQLTVTTTQSADMVRTLDGQGRTLRTYTAGNARIDRAADASGRTAVWTLPLEDTHPVALQTGEAHCDVLWPDEEQTGESSPEEPSFRLYSQMDGTWRTKAYRKSSLEQSGCAIFALSHALQLLGHHEEASLPEALARTYAFCLVDGGTLNATLIGNAGKEFGYKTRYKLYTSKSDIVRKFRQGAMFSFAIVQGHIALLDRLSDDGTKCHVIDSAPTATFERIKGEKPMRFDETTGRYIPLETPADIPGLLYYVDTEGFDGAEYWLSLDYVAERGVRLIQP